MTEAKRTATLSEWCDRLEEMYEQMEQEGFVWDFTTCCCGEGLRIKDETNGTDRTIY